MTQLLRLMVAGIFAVTLFAFVAPLSEARAAETIKWDDLVPETPAIIDPLASLTSDQRLDFDTWSSFRESGIVNPLFGEQEYKEKAAEAEKRLKDVGLKTDQLYESWLAWRAEIEAAGGELVKTLDGKSIRMAGYLMPLSFSDKGETEFLLVPYVGACIHVPPPPANQLIFVKLKDPYKVDDIYTPVWISGQMKTESSRQSLNLADGSAKVSVGYQLQTTNIEPYTD